MQKFFKPKQGFTLIEIMVVVAIIAILAILAMFMFMNNLSKGRDGRRKADLDRLKIAFEEYYDDHNCYPPAEWFDLPDDCGSANLSPYLSSIPCDKNTGKPYVLETDDTTCKWFKLYATFDLPDTDEQALAQRSATGSTKGNYGVSSSNTSVSVYFVTPGNFWCNAGNNCTSYDPTQWDCTPNYPDPNCGPEHCATTIGSCTPR